MPSAASPPSNLYNSGLQSSSGDTKEELLALMKEKDNVEVELKALGSILDSVCSSVPWMVNGTYLRTYFTFALGYVA